MNERPLTGSRDSATDGPDRDRAQTVQDFAVGVGIFLLAVAFVFTFVPTIITPFADAGGASTAQADRIAATIVEDASTGDGNEIDMDVFDNGNQYDGDSEELADALGLRKSNGHAIDRVNITVVEIDEVGHSNPTYVAESGDTYDGQVGASATRIVTTSDGSTTCDPACRLTVRVW